jgi:hypothetical protein
MLFLSTFICGNLPLVDGQRYQPSKYACPVTANIFPEKEERDGLIKYTFAQIAVARRISISLMSSPKGRIVDIGYDWIGQEGWGKYLGLFAVKADGNANCFFLGGEAGIPENIPLREFHLRLPEGVQFKDATFSSLPSELVSTTCPMPELQKEITKSYEEHLLNPGDQNTASRLMRLLERLIPTYDCRRSYDYKPVPAWWLADYKDAENWIRFVDRQVLANNKLALKLYMEFFNTADGYIATGMMHFLRDTLLSRPSFILENWPDLQSYKEMIFNVLRSVDMDEETVIEMKKVYQDAMLREPKYAPACKEILEALGSRTQ